MDDSQLNALIGAATDGVTFDGLSVAETDDGYTFETPDTERSGLDEDTLRMVAAENPWYVSNWYVWTRAIDGIEQAFCRWIERAEEWSVPQRYEALADGMTREWGELAITATVGTDGDRTYHVRHREDVDRDSADLDVLTDPYEARELVTYDEQGRYRPLKTAPTLQRGWAFLDLTPADLLRTVDLIYPATVHNWHREREGELDVSHWRETADRQTGIYDLVTDLPPEAVEWMASACCVDSQCLKRREWDLDEETPLDVPRGDGEFPCREPCSLVVAAARKWTKLEAEEPRTYEFELTPSEKEQLEELVEAVADGRVDEIREADVSEGANRYRARYLRAKRFEDGDLCGVPTDEGD